jgi:hypothetical protein
LRRGRWWQFARRNSGGGKLAVGIHKRDSITDTKGLELQCSVERTERFGGADDFASRNADITFANADVCADGDACADAHSGTSAYAGKCTKLERKNNLHGFLTITASRQRRTQRVYSKLRRHRERRARSTRQHGRQRQSNVRGDDVEQLPHPPLYWDLREWH